MRMSIVLLLFVLGVCPACVSLTGNYALQKRPKQNVILISIDTLRADHLGCYGYGRNTSPNIDKMAKESVLFETAISASATTLPSITTLMSSKHLFSHGVLSNFIVVPDDIHTLAEYLHEEGYVTAGFVSHVVLRNITNVAQGFDYYSDNFSDSSIYVGKKHVTSERNAQDVNQKVLPFLQSEKLKEPFFLWIHYYDPHLDYHCPEEYKEYFVNDTMEQEPFSNPASFSTNSIAHSIAHYDGEIRYVDTHIGELLDVLSAHTLMDRSIFILTADHGEGLSEHGWWGHGKYIYEEQTRVPLLIMFPDRKHAGMKVSEVVGGVDILPTILDVLGIPPKQEMQGESLLPLTEGRKKEKDYALIQRRRYPEKNLANESNWAAGDSFGVRKKQWKLIYSTGSEHELYDLFSDPDEQINLYQNETETAWELENILLSEMKEGSAIPSQDITDEGLLAELRSLGYIG